MKVIIIGGGAAGFFAAIHVAELLGPSVEVIILEKGPEVLTKVRISGGGRCNVTHACDTARELVGYYPRGYKSLMGTFTRWGAQDTVEWFGQRGVELKTEADGRMFPVTDNSQTVIDCLQGAARDAGVTWQTRCGVSAIQRDESGLLVMTDEGEMRADAVLVATGGVRSAHAMKPTRELGQDFESAVPSLFTFKLNDSRLDGLQGLSVADVEVKVGKLQSNGPLLVTHWGVSGPAILKLSAWGARELEKVNYTFTLKISWLPQIADEDVKSVCEEARVERGKRKILNDRCFPELPKRLWERLCLHAGIGEDQKWSELNKVQLRALTDELLRGNYEISGKSINKDEFVTCGGVPLRSVNLKTMESKELPHVYYAGEVLDIDGVTGGYNFQAAWATGRIAAEGIAQKLAF